MKSHTHSILKSGTIMIFRRLIKKLFLGNHSGTRLGDYLPEIEAFVWQYFLAIGKFGVPNAYAHGDRMLERDVSSSSVSFLHFLAFFNLAPF